MPLTGLLMHRKLLPLTGLSAAYEDQLYITYVVYQSTFPLEQLDRRFQREP